MKPEVFLKEEIKFAALLSQEPTCSALETYFLDIFHDGTISQEGCVFQKGMLVARFYVGKVTSPSFWEIQNIPDHTYALIKHPDKAYRSVNEFGTRNGICILDGIAYATDVDDGTFQIARPVRGRHQLSLQSNFNHLLSLSDPKKFAQWQNSGTIYPISSLDLAKNSR